MHLWRSSSNQTTLDSHGSHARSTTSKSKKDTEDISDTNVQDYTLTCSSFETYETRNLDLLKMLSWYITMKGWVTCTIRKKFGKSWKIWVCSRMDWMLLQFSLPSKRNKHFSNTNFDPQSEPVINFIQKIDFPVIGQNILDIFNSSIRESVVPSAWKKSLILATNKVASPRTMGDMRPIALLCFLSKVFAKLMYLQLNEYVETCSLLDSF